MKSPLDYYENLELNPEAPAPAGARMPDDSADSSLVDEMVLAEEGSTCLTRSAVQEAVHEAVTDAVQAAVSGAVAAAVAAAVRANVAVDPQEAENRFRQKYLGLGPVEGTPVFGMEGGGFTAAADPFLPEPPLLVAVPQLVAKEEGAVVVQTAPVGTEISDPMQDFVAVPELVEFGDDPLAFEPVTAEAAPADLSAKAEDALSAPVLTEPPVEAEPNAEAEERAALEPTLEVCSDLEEESTTETAVESIAEDGAAHPEAAVPCTPEPQVTLMTPPATPPVAPAGVPASAVVPSAPLAAAPVESPVPAEDAAPAVAAEPVPAQAQAMPPGEWGHTDKGPGPSQELLLRNEKTIQFVGFLIGGQMYAVPSIMIREVLRKQPLSRLPVHTRYVSGVINLRGGVIPLVSLRELLQAGPAEDGCFDQFCIITGAEGMWIGLAVDRIRSMYVIKQEDVVWNVSGLLGLDDETIIGLFELEEKLVPILSVERVGAILLEEGLDMEALAAP